MLFVQGRRAKSPSFHLSLQVSDAPNPSKKSVKEWSKLRPSQQSVGTFRFYVRMHINKFCRASNSSRLNKREPSSSSRHDSRKGMVLNPTILEHRNLPEVYPIGEEMNRILFFVLLLILKKNLGLVISVPRRKDLFIREKEEKLNNLQVLLWLI